MGSSGINGRVHGEAKLDDDLFEWEEVTTPQVQTQEAGVDKFDINQLYGKQSEATEKVENIQKKAKEDESFEWADDEPAPVVDQPKSCLLYTSPSPRDRQKDRMPSSA
eukprot:TRINITY_DN21241_c0_g1_i1.p1 TRINITY_DN21241_c0_g1~~TRINITY_DN21241_c0_g1_i1.p1  ORF type:complete len:108 (+),score=32.50 TRINITY_DN21241_c0_g1_i1:52-375(+)